MGKYLELKGELNELAKQVEDARRVEQGEVIEHIRRLMYEYKLTVRDVFGAGYSSGRLAFAPAKYRNPETGETWGGRGRPPRWMKGKDRAYFLIDRGDEKPKEGDGEDEAFP
ncbi:H-NS histone family protein [Burkholderia territorii]|uniref:H-NS histone family protein n=1 Tax=Burkholderia territorii TaxID=1503055 RepID=UPI0009C10222|nr:H-NS histone family protein [Burkholderia territorii]